MGFQSLISLKQRASRGWLAPLLVLSLVSACAPEKDEDDVKPDEEAPSNEVWRYFDRELYFPTGVSVAPEMAAAQELIQEALRDLEVKSDLGRDFFIFKSEEDSLLQPVFTETSYQGRNWRSFWQVWDDELFNEHVAAHVGTPLDQDIVVSFNENNPREFYVINRLSCFVAGEACVFPTQGQTKMMVWRSVGYLVGLRFGDGASSDVMKPGASPTQETESEQRKFIAELNGALERVRNEIPPPPSDLGVGAAAP